MTPERDALANEIVCACGASLCVWKIAACLRMCGWAACCRCGMEIRYAE